MTRQERAKELLILYPDWGRRQVNAQLKQEFGKGLRWSSIDVLSRGLGRPASLKAQLRVVGFSPRERRIIGKFISGGAKNYIKDMIADRLKLKLQAEKLGLTRRQFWVMVRRHYYEMGWLTPKTATEKNKDRIGKPDVFAMLRYFRHQASVPEDYAPKPHHKPYRLLDKVTVLAQKAKYRAKKRVTILIGERPSGNVQDWIKQLRDTIAKTTESVRIAQLEAQIARLEATK